MSTIDPRAIWMYGFPIPPGSAPANTSTPTDPPKDPRTQLDDEVSAEADAMSPAKRARMYKTLFTRYGIRISDCDEILRKAFAAPK